MRIIMVITLGLFITAFGCKKENPPTEQSPLIETKWVLAHMQDTKTNAIINYPNDATNKISITFKDSQDLLTFDGVCNGGVGKYTYSLLNASIDINNIVTTEVYCNNYEWEVYTTVNLHDAYKYEIKENMLIIYSKGTYNLYFNH